MSFKLTQMVIRESRRLSLTDFAVLTIIADLIGPTGDCYPTISYIAARGYMHRNTVQNSINRLEHRRVLLITKHIGQRSHYSINEDKLKGHTYTPEVHPPAHEECKGYTVQGGEVHSSEALIIDKEIDQGKDQDLAPSAKSKSVGKKMKVHDIKKTLKSGKSLLKGKTKVSFASLWRNAVLMWREEHGLEVGTLNFTQKNYGQLNMLHKTLGEIPEWKMQTCIEDWKNYCLYVAEAVGIDIYPDQPSIGFMLKYANYCGLFLAMIDGIAPIQKPKKKLTKKLSKPKGLSPAMIKQLEQSKAEESDG